MQTAIKPVSGMLLSPEAYEDLILSGPDETWELVRGRLREKPLMPIQHGDAAVELVVQLRNQLDRRVVRVSTNHARLKRADHSYFIPDVAVTEESDRTRSVEEYRGLNLHVAPALLVVEIWSPSTGDYDLDTKIRGYQQRGDREIWRLHPFEHYLTVWHRQTDGTFVERTIHGGLITPTALPEVTINLDDFFI